MTPTGRTLCELRRDGYTAAVVESWIPRLNVRRDLFGVGDVLGVKAGEAPLLIQCTSVESRKQKQKPACAPGLHLVRRSRSGHGQSAMIVGSVVRLRWSWTTSTSGLSSHPSGDGGSRNLCYLRERSHDR